MRYIAVFYTIFAISISSSLAQSPPPAYPTKPSLNGSEYFQIYPTVPPATKLYSTPNQIENYIFPGGGLSITPGNLGVSVTPNPITGTGTIGAQFPVLAAVTSTTHSVFYLSSCTTPTEGTCEQYSWLPYNSSSNGTFTLLQSTNAYFPPGTPICFQDIGTGTLTITATTSTIYGVPLTTGSIVLNQNGWACLEADSSNNYQASGWNSGWAIPPTAIADCVTSSGALVARNSASCLQTPSLSTANCGSSIECIYWDGLVGNNYKVKCSNLVPQEATSFVLQYGEGGTPTWETSGYLTVSWFQSTHSGVDGLNTGTSGIALDSGNDVNTGADYGITFVVEPQNLQGATYKHATLSSTYFIGAGTYQEATEGGAAYNGDTNPITSIRVITAAENISAGQCWLQWEGI